MSKKVFQLSTTITSSFQAYEKNNDNNNNSRSRSTPTPLPTKTTTIRSSMHTVPFSQHQSAPISSGQSSDLSRNSVNTVIKDNSGSNNQDNEEDSRCSTMAVSTIMSDVVKTAAANAVGGDDDDEDPASPSIQVDTNSSNDSNNWKPVVTPDGPSSNAVPSFSDDDDEDISPPCSPPRVTSALSQPPGSIDVSPTQGLLTVTTITTTAMTANRSRILSLDRAGTAMDQWELLQEEEEAAAAAKENGDNEESSQADSSDGESSYFAKHLPSPKTGRRVSSYSSAHSQKSAANRARARTSDSNNTKTNNNDDDDGEIKPSDASLSFSDESDEDDEMDDLPHSAESPEPVAPLGGRGQVADMQLQTITRVHSVRSLDSTDDEEEDDNQSHPTAGVLSPNSSISGNSHSDPSVTAELSTVRASSSNHKTSGGSSNNSNTNNSMPSGRRSPLPADAAAFMSMHHAYSMSPAASAAGYGPSSSPPTIFPGYNVAPGPPYPGMLHPQAQAWSMNAAGNNDTTGGAGTGKSNDTGAGLNFAYSDDDDTDQANFVHQLANGGDGAANNAGAYGAFGNSGAAGPNGNNGGHPNGGFGGGGGGPGGDGNNGMNNGNMQQSGGQGGYGYQGTGPLANGSGGGGGGDSEGEMSDDDDEDFKVYWQRWVMLFFMSLLNLLSDWTCYSVAPIAILTQETFGEIDPERLVVLFLGANAFATACEPIILARLGLKKTVLFGSLLLTIGSIIKSGGLPPIIQSELVRGRDEWRLSLGFFLVGLSQPLYQCTPALLSASWFPEQERTMATGVALNANQLGIGCAFVFGTLLVSTSDDIPSYFGLLSVISTLTFFGTLFFFDDAPPTPPSSSAKVMKGDIVVPDMGSIVQSVRKMSSSIRDIGSNTPENAKATKSSKAPTSKDGSTRRRNNKGVAAAPSPAMWGSTKETEAALAGLFNPQAEAPSPMMPGHTQSDDDSPLYAEGHAPNPDMLQGGYPPMQPAMMPYGAYPPQYPPQAYQQQGYYDPRMQQQQQQFYPPPPHPYYYGYQNGPPPGMYPPPMNPAAYGYEDEWEEGAEPVVTLTDHHLDIHIRDDQVILSTRTCMARPGFIHSLVAFTVSGIVINTLSTYMDYLVTLNGAGREYVGIVGGSFQAIIMMSSLIVGGQTDKTRAYYSVIICMLVMGAFGLAQCGVSLDADRGSDLRWSLLIVAALVGPLQPVSTELGVEVAYPLSENTVLVIQQLFSNLLSALFIPFFKSLKDVGIGISSGSDMEEKPQYTFSFYLLIVLHAGATIFFATFRGRYLRYEHELEKKTKQEQKKLNKAAAFHPLQGGMQPYSDSYSDIPDSAGGEHQPLTSAPH